MHSRLVITAVDLDPAAVAAHLQLKGSVVNGYWVFESAPRLSERSGDVHAAS